MSAHPGIDIANAALHLTRPEHRDDSPTLADLTTRLAHLTGKPDAWREAVAYLAAQLNTERRTSENARANDARFALHQIAAQVDWARDRGVL